MYLYFFWLLLLIVAFLVESFFPPMTQQPLSGQGLFN